MESKPTARFQDVFSWTATIIGFIVDTIALIGLFSAFRLGSIVTDQVDINIPKINIGSTSLRWKDATLVIFFYLAFSILFFMKAKVVDNKKEKGEKQRNSLISFIAINFLFLIIFLWFLVFVLSDSIHPYFYQILLGWLVSLIFSTGFINSYFFNETTTIFGYLLKTFVAFIFIAPILALMNEFLFDVSLLSALGITAVWFVFVMLYGIISTMIWLGLIIGVIGFASTQKST